MKITVDVLGVSQALDFNTKEATQTLTLNVLGTIVQVPITEAEMEAITRAAMDPTAVWDDTREQGAPVDPSAVSTPAPERDFNFSSMAGLTEQEVVSDDVEQPEAALTQGLFEPSDDDRARALRERKPQRRTVPQDEAGNPVVAQQPALPPMRGFGGGDDDGFAQG